MPRWQTYVMGAEPKKIAAVEEYIYNDFQYDKESERPLVVSPNDLE